MKSTTTVMAGAALALFACSPSGFNTPTLLNKPRILAIQAEPPQPAAPDPVLGTPGGSTTLRALVYQPPPSVDGGTAEPSVTYDWWWCPLPMSSTDPSQCPIKKQEDADQLFAGIPNIPPLHFGSNEETATFTNPFPASMLASLCNGNFSAILGSGAGAASTGALAASGGLTFNCTIAGFPITVMLVLRSSAVLTSDADWPALSPGDLPAVFTVYLPINDAIPANLNPVVSGVYVTADNSDPLDPNSQLDEVGTQLVVRNSKVSLVLGMLLSDSEMLPDPNQVLPSIDPNDPNSVLGANLTDRERLHVDWYTEGGDFTQQNGVGGDSTGYLGGDPNDAVSPFSSSRQTYWETPKSEDYQTSLARLIVVVRDSRGGVTWTSGVATLVDSLPDGGAVDAPQADSGEVSLAPDAGVPDSLSADAGEVISAFDAGVADAPQADVGELAPDAGAPDAEQVSSADALLETAP
jgi:hypothetical protein